MWGVKTLSWVIIRDKTIKLKIWVPMWLLRNCNNKKMKPCVTFFWNKSKIFWFVYTRLVTRLHSSTFVYDSSTFVYTRLVTRLYIWNRSFWNGNNGLQCAYFVSKGLQSASASRSFYGVNKGWRWNSWTPNTRTKRQFNSWLSQFYLSCLLCRDNFNENKQKKS